MKILVTLSVALVATAILGAACLTGCGEKKSNAIPGWVEYQNSGVAFSLPSEVKVTDLSSGDLNEIEKRAKTQFRNQVEMQKSVINLASSGAMRLVASLTSPNPSGVANSLNLVVLPVGPKQTAVDLIDANRVKMLAAAVPGSLSAKLRDFPAGEGAYFEFDVESSSPPRLQITYLFVHDDKQYLFTFSCGPSEKRIWGNIAESAMRSVHFEP